MKVLALIEVAAGADVQQVRGELKSELEGSWRLFAAGTLREAYATETPTRVVFVLEVGSVQEARDALASLPLVASGLMHVQVLELRPFTNWAMLFTT